MIILNIDPHSFRAIIPLCNLSKNFTNCISHLISNGIILFFSTIVFYKPVEPFIIYNNAYFHDPEAVHSPLNSILLLIALSGLTRNSSIALAVTDNFAGAC